MTTSGCPAAFEPFQLGPVALRNRLVRTAAFEGLSAGGQVTPALIEHHERMARGGIGMTTVAYCSVSADGRTYGHQLYAREAIRAGLAELCDRVHAAGAQVSLQLGHAGGFASQAVIGARPIAPSPALNLYGLTYSREMTQDDLARVVDDFGRAAQLAREVGFDAVEIHAGHGYLLSQFLSPYANHRRDAYGGDLAGRLRFPLAVLARVNEHVGRALAVIVKLNLTDGFPGGLQQDEAVAIAQHLASVPVTALFLSGGFVSKTPFYMLRGKLPVREMVANEKSPVRKVGLTLFGRLLVAEYPFQELFFLEDALRIRAAVDLPLVLVGGINSGRTIAQALGAGFELVALGRPLLFDPDFPRRLARGEVERTGCTYCNACIAEMDRGGVRCTDPSART